MLIDRVQSGKAIIGESRPGPSQIHVTQMEFDQSQFPCLNPIHPHMENHKARLQTFAYYWPSHKVKASVENIAEAGFFFVGELPPKVHQNSPFTSYYLTVILQAKVAKSSVGIATEDCKTGNEMTIHLLNTPNGFQGKCIGLHKINFDSLKLG